MTTQQPVIAGEEWRNVNDYDRHLYQDLKPEAEILAEAEAGIERHRKADVRLRLVDRTGAAHRGLAVDLVQERHAFVFGCSSGGVLADDADPIKRERNRLFCELFNGTHAKCYWDEKWHHPIETRQGMRDTSLFLAEIDWAVANNLVVRGHPLVWTVPKAIPQWVRRYPYEQQLRFMEHNLRSLIQAAAGRVKLWDVVNEMLWEPSLRNLATRDWPHLESTDEMLTYIDPALRWARDEDPDAAYVLNDYGLEMTYTTLKGVNAPLQRRRFVELVAALRARGNAPDAIGTQGHVGKWFRMGVVQKVFDELAAGGVPLQISEFWAGLEDCPDPEGKTKEQLTAERDAYVRNYYTVAFGHPSVEHLSWWGGKHFFDRDGWVPSSLYKTVHGLVKQRWWTNAKLAADGDGVITARAFHGDYRLRWRDASGTPHNRALRIETGRTCEGTLVLG
jgi:endo-1,4-beta-xylanase